MQIETRSLSRSWRRSDVRIARRRVGGARDGVGAGVCAAGARARRRGAAHALRAQAGARPQPLRAWSCLCEGLAMQARTRRRACMARVQSCLCGRPRQAPAVRQQARARLTASVNLSCWSQGGCCCANYHVCQTRRPSTLSTARQSAGGGRAVRSGRAAAQCAAGAAAGRRANRRRFLRHRADGAHALAPACALQW